MHIQTLTLALLALGCDRKESTEEDNTAPVAEAGPSQNLHSNALVTLSGSGSYDPDGQPLTYYWSFDTVPPGSGLPDMEQPFTVNGDLNENTSFTPDASGTYVVSLTVEDSEGLQSDPDRTLVEIAAGEAPEANAGADQNAQVGATVQLDGSESFDPLGRDLSYSWNFAKLPEHSDLSGVDGADTASGSFIPDTSGLYIVALVVDNGLSASEPDATIIVVEGEATDAPTANAGVDIAGTTCSPVTLDGSASSDPNDEPLSYLWSIQSLPADSTIDDDDITDRSTESPVFSPDVAGDFVFSLGVHDGFSWSTPDTVSVTVAERPWNSAPVVSPGVASIISGGEAICETAGFAVICAYCDPVRVTIGTDAVVNDPDRDWTVAEWAVLDGSAALDDSASLITEVVFTGARPDAFDECTLTDYEFSLTVSDCAGESTTETIVHEVECCGYDPDATPDEGEDTGGAGDFDGGPGDGEGEPEEDIDPDGGPIEF